MTDPNYSPEWPRFPDTMPAHRYTACDGTCRRDGDCNQGRKCPEKSAPSTFDKTVDAALMVAIMLMVVAMFSLAVVVGRP